MKILVTGGAGYIGSELCKALSNVPNVTQVLIYDNLSAGRNGLFDRQHFPKKCTFMHADILDGRSLRKAMKGAEWVYHLAGVSASSTDKDGHYLEQVNHWGTAEVCNAVEEMGVPNFVYLSSTNVYGNSTETKTEKDIPATLQPNALSKLRGEEQVLRLPSTTQAWIFRCANVFGYSAAQRFDNLVNKLFFDARFKNRINIHGNGRQMRALIDLPQVVGCLIEVMNKPYAGGIYNLSAFNISVLDCVEYIQPYFSTMEFIFVNAHLNLPSTLATPAEALGIHTEVQLAIDTFFKQLPACAE